LGKGELCLAGNLVIWTLTFCQKNQGPIRCNLITAHPGFFYPAQHQFLMDGLDNPKYISFLATSPSVEWFVQDVTTPILVKKGSRILIHHTSLSETDCYLIDTEKQLLLDQSGLYGHVPHSERFVSATSASTPTSHSQENSSAPPPPLPASIRSFSASSIGADAAPLSFPVSRRILPLPFPRTFVKEMIEGLKPLMALEGASDEQLAAAFKDAFPDCKYGKTSVKTAKNIFWRALEIGGHYIIRTYVDYGHTDKGLWKRFKQNIDCMFSSFTSTIPSNKLRLVLNPSKGRKLIITDEMRASLARLDFASLSDEEGAGGGDSRTSSPSPITQPDSPLPSPSQPAQPALPAPASMPGSSGDEEELEDDAYEIILEVAFEDFQLIDGRMLSCLPNNPVRSNALLGIKPRAKGESKEIYMVSYAFIQLSDAYLFILY
jgi:hypothetical protein